MDELRFVRREDQSLIVATEAGEEFRLVVDEAALAELRHLSRPSRGPSKINPREVQALVRAGKTRSEIAELTGLDESDIERYEEPVLAERRYILELARAIPVLTTTADDSEQEFGAVIAERLIGLNAIDADWSSWRDAELGWMIGLEFLSHEVSHRAVWSFDHRKGVLTPITADATTLSKQGDVGDRLIPKLRAVDAEDRFDSDAFDVDALREGDEGDEPSAPKVAPDHPSTGSIPVVGISDDFERRQHIEERAIKSPERELPDLGQTADLLDALRRRRGERESTHEAESADTPRSPIPIGGGNEERDTSETGEGLDDSTADTEEVEELWPSDDTQKVQQTGPRLVPQLFDDESQTKDEDQGGSTQETPSGPHGTENSVDDEVDKDAGSRKRGRGRASIPSWDDILFGTRSEDDPA